MITAVQMLALHYSDNESAFFHNHPEMRYTPKLQRAVAVS